jgi:phosphonate degradation associated HDIG domain protein
VFTFATSPFANLMPTPQQIADEIFDLYAKYGRADYIGEPVSQIEHMAQAAQCAQQEGFNDEVVLAAFFHDIGHICVNEEQYKNMGGFGNQEHEKVGAEFLRQRGFSESLCQMVGNHVIAKRYLTYKYPDYYAKLSEASKETLRYQGGPMSIEEATEFEQDPLFTASIKLREWDELAKEEHKPLPDLDVYKQMAVRLLRR